MAVQAEVFEEIMEAVPVAASPSSQPQPQEKGKSNVSGEHRGKRVGWLRRATMAAVVVGTTLAGTLVAATPASAYFPDDYYSRVWSWYSWGAWLRTCANTGCQSAGGAYGDFMYNGTQVYMLCYTDAQWTSGNYASNRWFKVIDVNAGGLTGYVHSSLVDHQRAVRPC